MARRKVDVEENQSDLYPEIDTNKPGEKAMLTAARKYHNAKIDRDQTLSTAKEKMDGYMQKLIGLMHENKCEKFRYKGITAEIIPGKEKAQVRVDGDDETPPGDDE